MGPTHTPTQSCEQASTSDAAFIVPVGTEAASTTIPAGCVAEASTGVPAARARRLAERGMVTAEYAVGILSAVAFALVLLKVFHDNSVFTAMLHYVTSVIGQLSSQIK